MDARNLQRQSENYKPTSQAAFFNPEFR